MKHPLRILFYSGTYLPAVNGVAISADTFARQLREFGHHVDIAAPHIAGEVYDPNVCRYPSLPNPVRPDYPIALAPGRQLWRTLSHNNYDIVHSHHPFHIGSVAARIAKNNNAKFVLHNHSQYVQYVNYIFTFPLITNVIQSALYHWVKSNMAAADLVIAPSQPIVEDIHNRFPGTHVLAIPTGIQPSFKSNAPQGWLKHKLHLSPQTKLYVTVSRIAPEKEIDKLIHAFAQSTTNNHLLICGTGSAKADLEQLVADVHIADKVSFIGKIDRQELPDYYADADYFVTASPSETQGLTTVESQIVGTPAIVRDVPVNREFAYAESSQFFSSVDDLVAILDQPARYSEGTIQNMQQWTHAFTVEATTKKLESAYYSLIDNADV